MMIWSESQERMVNKGFTLNGRHYTWNDADEVYYRDDTDDTCYMEIPKGAKLD